MPEQYDMMEKHFVGAVRDVMGDKATPEVSNKTLRT